MANYRSFEDLADENDVIIQVLPENKGGPRLWHHYIHDLDYFFTKIYRYHQKSGFTCLVVSQILDLLKFAFVILFTIFLFSFVDYPLLFRDKPSTAQKVTLFDIVISPKDVTLGTIEIILIICAVCFWLIRLIKVIQSIFVYYAIKSFYVEALRINDCTQYTWQEVQNRLIQAQHFCSLQERTLSELDIHNRILRHKNYMIALLNKNLLPINFKLPIIGEVNYFSKGLEFNIELLLFKGPFSIFETSWKLKDEYKQASQRQACADRFARNCIILASINFILLPLILIWQILFIFYSNTETLKRDPSYIFASKNWSLYARLFCRHFNELDHQLNERLNRGYKAAAKYMNSFTSPLLEILAKNIMFVSGSILAVLIILTIYDDDVISVEHFITLMAILGMIIAASRGFIGPDVPLKQTKAELHANIVQHIHYSPHRYSPYSIQAQKAMSKLFQYKVQTIIEGLLSPLVTPYIILEHLKSKSLEYIDFFRNHTVELSNAGDVCIFAMMNIRAHGNPIYMEDKVALKPAIELPNETDVPQNLVTDNGKLELSLIHFKLTNPTWQPEESQQQFIDFVTQNVSSIIEKSQNEKARVKSGLENDCHSTQNFQSQSQTSIFRKNEYFLQDLDLEESDLRMSISSQLINSHLPQIPDDRTENQTENDPLLSNIFGTHNRR